MARLRGSFKFQWSLCSLFIGSLLFTLQSAAQDSVGHDSVGQSQKVLEKGSEDFVDSSTVNTYIDGIPPISFAGQPCAQSQAARINGTNSVDVHCYFTQGGVERQCNFEWDAIGHTAKISVSTYEKSQVGKKEVTVQSNSHMGSKLFVNWKDIAKTASDMVNQYCGAELKKKTVTRFTEESIDSLANGIPCQFGTQQNDGEKNPTRKISCSTLGPKATQCWIEDDDCAGLLFFSGIKKDVMKYEDRATKTGTTASTQACKLTSSSIHLRRPDDTKFKKIAFEWLNKNCK
jgi:hypothetical protein